MTEMPERPYPPTADVRFIAPPGRKPPKREIQPPQPDGAHPSHLKLFWKDAAQKILILVGTLLFACIASSIIHECGHALNLVATGGQVDRIEVSLFGTSSVVPVTLPESTATFWGGYFWQVMAPLLLFLIIWSSLPRFSFWVLALLIASFARAAEYLLWGVRYEYGDPRFLMRHGVGKTALVSLGLALALVAVVLLPILAALLGLGRRRCSWKETFVVLAAVLFGYVGATTAIDVYRAEIGGAVDLARALLLELYLVTPRTLLYLLPGLLLGAPALHFLAGLFRCRPFRRREASTGWLSVACSLALAGAVAGAAVFGFPPEPRTPTEELHTEIFHGAGCGTIAKLIEEGADVNGLHNCSTALLVAIRTENFPAARYLIENGADVDQPGRHGFRPIHRAVWAKEDTRMELLRLLLEHGARVNGRTHYGATALHFAAGSDSADVVRLLIERDADVSLGAAHAETPLHWAGSEEVAEALLAAGADLNAQTYLNETPLVTAARAGRTDVARFLVRRGAALEARNQRGETALHHAAKCGHEEIVELLLEAGADPKIKNEDGHTPVDLARKWRHEFAARLLESAASD